MLDTNMVKIILILFMALTHSYSAVAQSVLQDGLWQLMGFSGSHLTDSSARYNEDATREIIDIADNNTTYLVKEDSSTNGQLAYIRNDYTLSASYISSTTKLRSSIGLFAIKNSLSPSGKTTLKTNLDSAVKLKVKEAKIYNPNIPHYRMYLKGKTSPILRIDYQADYEGSSFRVKFGNEIEDYVAYFDNAKTFNSATLLQDSPNTKLDLSAYSAKIRDSVDFSSQDNNLTKMRLNEFEIKDSDGAYNKDLTDYTSNSDYDVTVYRFKDGKWDIFNSINQASSNTFDTFDVGQGYWVQANNARTGWSKGVYQNALISRDSLNVDADYSKLKNGWNVMSFSDTYIRYSPTGIFVPQSIISEANGSIRIQRLNRSGDERHDIRIPKVLFGSIYNENNISSSARLINIYAKQQEELFGFKDKIKAIPAIKVEDNGSEMRGIIIISDSKFEVNSSGNTSFPITTISGQAVTQTSYSRNFLSVYGEYMNFLNLNELDTTDVNVSMSFQMPKYKSSPLVVGDLGDINKTQNARNILRTLNSLATKAGNTEPSTTNAVYLTDLDFSDNIDYNVSNNYDTLLIASGARFSVSDSTYTKVYKFNRNGKFKLISSDGSIDIDSGVSTNINTLITSINNAKSTTEVTATSLGANSDGDIQFMLTSTKKGVKILENDSINLFDDISLTSSSIANSDLSKGSITSTHTFTDLLNVDISFNREALDNVGDMGGVEPGTNIEEDLKTTEFEALINPPVVQKVFDGDVNLTSDGSGPVIMEENAYAIVQGNLKVVNSLFIAGTLFVAGDLNITFGGRLRIFSTGTLIVKGDAYTIEALEFSDSPAEPHVDNVNKGKVYIRGKLVEGIPANRTGTAEILVVKNLPAIEVQQNGIGYLDVNTSGVPVGLFDLKGQPFPNTTPNLQSNPSPSLDYPLSGGLIETFYKNNKKINSIMTMEYSSNNQGYWKITDLTKNIDTLYGNSYDSDNEFNNDYQGIFHLHSNKAYWVNVSSLSNASQRPKDIKSALELKDSKLTLQSYTHFSNTFNKGISTTQNHINHRLNIKFKDDGKFIVNSGENKDYYNVVAIIKGVRYYLKRNGTYFSLDVNDNDMPLKETKINEKDEPIILEAYDGTGLALKEKSNETHFKIKYFKPNIPTLTWNNENELILDSINQRDVDSNISKLELYARSVSDIDSIRQRALLSENNLTKNTDKFLSWNYDENTSLHGGLTLIRAVINKYDDTKQVSFYSDMRAILYAPLKRGHTLEANTTNKIGTLPYSNISKKILNKDNGVQLTYLNTNNDINNISLAYYPQGSEGVKSLQGTGFGASRTMFLRVDSGATNKDAIGVVKYLPEYINSIFYIEFNNKLYQGRFANDDRYSNDGNAYNLEAGTISSDTFSNGSVNQADNSGGRFIEGGQGI